MNPRTQERVEQWDSRPFSGGYEGLADLAAADFSGAVSGAGTWLFMLNGRVVGVIDGAIEDFEAASGTVYEAPHPSLPLLCTMEERGGETRANYYTNETPLREVDQTLQEGTFTGYVELSENVLSGDYYAVYYGGRRMAAAYIGNADRLLTGDEAFERADDEVGIYEVIDVEIDVTDVPGTGASGDSADSRTDSDDGTDAEVGSTETVTEPEVGAGTDTTAEPSTDPTESAIESIDISGSEPDTAASDESAASTAIEDITLDDTRADSDGIDEVTESAGLDESGESTGLEGTDEPSGITANDDPAPESASDGITDAGVASESDSVAADDDRTVTDPETSESPVDERAAAADTAPATEPESSDAATDPGGSDEIQEQSSTEPETSGSSPDLAEVEAAAEQLDQNDISWTEEDAASEADAATPVEEADPNGSAEPTGQSEPQTQSDQSAAPEETEERFEEEAQWRETRRIPSLDPDNSEPAESEADRTAGRSANARGTSETAAATGQADSGSRETSTSSSDSSASASQERANHQQRTQQEASQRTGRADSGGSSGSGGESRTATAADSSSADRQRLAELTQRIETLEEQRDRLASAAEELEAERDQLRSENEERASTIDRLQSRIAELEAELERTREAAADAGESAAETPAASTQLPPQRALAETNLFVRYGSKSQPTLETAHDGGADRGEVASNLRLEHHTGFDAADVAVDGEPYETFLTGTMEYRFVDWLTEMVLYEIRDTGNADALADLYDAIPRIDRAELGATISLEDDETEDVPDQVTFDVVAFDKMGNPLVVANLNDSRDPASEDMLAEMEEAASAVKANYPDLAAAIVVTSSYFEPGALEVAEQATSGGFLSRGSKLSYVNLSRKQGYHLCLVESRSEGFHMNVPEL